MKRVLFLIVLSTCILYSDLLYAQDYKASIGARAGHPSSFRSQLGFNFKVFMSERAAVEGIVSWMFRGREMRFTALYQHHFDIPVEGLRWYLGGGGYAGIADTYWHPHYRYRVNHPNPELRRNRVIPIFGLAFVGGVEYKFRDLPIAVGVDHMPTFGLNHLSNDGFDASYLGNVGASFRYTFQ